MKTHSCFKERAESYYGIFRLIFVLFSLYLIGHAFYRWDGFKYSGSFPEFLPSLALITTLWTIVIFFTSMLIWLLCKAIKLFCQRIGWEIKIATFLLFIFFSLLSAVLIKNLLGHHKYIFLIFYIIPAFTFIFVWFFRIRAEHWLEIIHGRITPLVWLFGAFVIFSAVTVVYHGWLKKDRTVLNNPVQSVPADKNQPNIILVTFDALTAKNMSVYGYSRDTTPFISQWAKTASLFAKAESSGNITTPTTASLMTGKRIWTHQIYHLAGSCYHNLRCDVENLPAVLKEKGYYNIAFVVNYRASVYTKLGIHNSFDIAPFETDFYEPSSLLGYFDMYLYRWFGHKFEIYDWIISRDFALYYFLDKISGNYSKTMFPPEKAFNRLLELLDKNVSEPYFAWIHILPPHDSYLPPEPYAGIYNQSLEFRDYDSQEKFKNNSFKYLFKSQPVPQKFESTLKLLRDYYDEFIKYCDKQFEIFINNLTIRNRLKNTIIILSADHGESFEHGYFTHGGPFLYEQVTHVPLIIKEPGQAKGRVIPDLVEQIDIPLAILDLANISTPIWMEGRSFVPLMRNQKLSPKPAFSMTFEKNRSRGNLINEGTIAVWEGDYKLIYYIKEKESLLFNLKQDPDELTNLVAKEPKIHQHLLGLIQSHLKAANERITKGNFRE